MRYTATLMVRGVSRIKVGSSGYGSQNVIASILTNIEGAAV